MVYPVGTRVIIIQGWFASEAAQAVAAANNISFQPIGTVVFATRWEHRVKLDTPLFKSPLVTWLQMEDLQVITPKHAEV